MTVAVLLWIFAASLIVSLLFSTVSYALRVASRVRLEEELVRREREGEVDDILSARFDLALTASTLRLLCNTVTIVAVAWYFMQRNWDDPQFSHPFKVFGWTALVTVPLLLIFSVAIPQAWAKYAGEPFIAVTWPLLKMVHVLFLPLVKVLNVFDEAVRRLAGVSIGDDPDAVAEQVEQEILSAVAEGRAEGTVDEEQKKMIEGVISFRDQQVGQIMTPRTDIIAVDSGASVTEVRDKILKDGVSRVPVFEGTLDNVIGILYAKDLLTLLDAAMAGGGAVIAHADLKKIMRPPLFVPRTKPLRDLLREFRSQQVHMAIVLDEYGGTSGLVTTEDIVEQIVGDIADEYERPAKDELKRIDEHTVEVDARMNVSEFNRALGLSLPEDGDFQTLGGYVLSTLGVIPGKGERISADGIAIEVLDAEPRRVKKLRIELPREEAAESSSASAMATHE